MTQATAQLDYAPRAVVPRAVRVRRAAIIVGVVVLLASGVWVTPRAVRRLQVVYWQGRCMNYAAPSDQVVHATDLAELPRLLAPNTGYAGSFPTGHAFLVPEVYRGYFGNAKASRSFGTAFLHRRTTSKGEVRLVAVDVQVFNYTGGGKHVVLAATVMEPSGVVRGPRDTAAPTAGTGVQIFVGPGDKYVVFAGQPDPSDRSHFTIDYVFNGVRYTLDGWLKDDGSVQIERRD